ncbi:hypothetical protein TrRE_jg11714 [Triparma retinervis]|uniref:DNA/pantothenate metabolism flavoprotein C-terminal domain-containing protein n=1 Tax=Triparma retinervis TaxID=2557542 RepID=A0A9W7AGV4_9STRA|nr:hypothetical protein TrRE_jg11714 [Triparma retinervis]
MEVLSSLSSFINLHQSEARPIVLVTSGGTSVPLEKNMVRSLENFSTGSRGSCSAEHFLAKGYAVVFLYRPGSLLPFLRMISSEYGGLGEITPRLASTLAASFGEEAGGSFDLPSFVDPVKEFERANNKTMFLLDYKSVTQYLELFEEICKLLDACGRQAMVYAASAVSDFYIPEEKMAQHKIQSGEAGNGVNEDGCLNLKLYPVPKKLGSIGEWCSKAFVVSFKLETDTNILQRKSLRAIDKYKVNAVVGNILSTRKKTCMLYTGEDRDGLTLKTSGGKILEEEIIAVLVDMHFQHISEGGGAEVFRSMDRQEIRKARDYRLFRKMGTWKQTLFLVWEYVGPFVGIGIAALLKRGFSNRLR